MRFAARPALRGEPDAIQQGAGCSGSDMIKSPNATPHLASATFTAFSRISLSEYSPCEGAAPEGRLKAAVDLLGWDFFILSIIPIYQNGLTLAYLSRNNKGSARTDGLSRSAPGNRSVTRQNGRS